MKTILRKSTICLDSANSLKKVQINNLFEESTRVINEFIKILWEKQDFKSKFVSEKVETWLSARMLQCLGKQALACVKSQHKRKKKTMPVFKKAIIELDQRFISFPEIDNSFDLWVKIGSIGGNLKLMLPGRQHHHYNKLKTDGFTRKKSARLRKANGKIFLDVYFEKTVELRSNSTRIAADVGVNKLMTCSNGKKYGTELWPLLEKINKKKSGSRAQKRAIIERNEYINRATKEMLSDFQGNTLVLEDIKYLYYKKKGMNKLKRWNYSYLRKKLEMEAEAVGVQCLLIDPAYTSQTCSVCGIRDIKSRSKEVFNCTSCDFVGDADENASLNILSMGLDMGRYGAHNKRQRINE